MNCIISRGNQLLNVAWTCSKTINMSNSLINCVFELMPLPRRRPKSMFVLVRGKERLQGRKTNNRLRVHLQTPTRGFSSTCRRCTKSVFSTTLTWGAPSYVRRSGTWRKSAASAAVTSRWLTHGRQWCEGGQTSSISSGGSLDSQFTSTATWTCAVMQLATVMIDNCINLQLFSPLNSFACLFIF